MRKTLLILISMVLVIALGVFSVYQLIFDRDYPVMYTEYIEKSADEYDVPKALIYAVINVESGFKKDAVSSKGAMGLMQLMPSTAEEIGEKLKRREYDLTDAETNIEFGVYYLAYLYRVLGDWRSTVAAYNGGIGNVRKWQSDPNLSKDGITLDSIPFRETREYVRRVFEDKEKYESIINGNA